MKLYDASMNLVNTIRTNHDGFYGQVASSKYYLRSTETLHYYQYVRVFVESFDGSDWVDFILDGWTVKMIAGEREPTEAEWAEIEPSSVLMIGDIGDTEEADTNPYPFWIRVACAANTEAKLYRGLRVKVSFYRQPLGS